MTDEMDLAAAAEVRAQLAEVLAHRRSALASDLAGVLADQLALEDQRAPAWRHLADGLLEATSTAIRGAEAEDVTASVVDLDRLARGTLTTAQLFSTVHLAERLLLDDLASDGQLGATSANWPLVAQLVRRASFQVLTALTDHLATTPASGRVRDPLTTLIARPVFEFALAQEVRRAHRYQHPLAVILFDVDDLEAINTRYGVRVGDRLLERMGILVRRFFRTHDWVARVGGDAIAALLPQTALDDAVRLAERVQSMVETRLAFKDEHGMRVPVTLSAAVAGSDVIEPELDPADILAHAEAAVRRARQTGRVERVVLVPGSVSLLGAAHLLGLTPGAVRRLVRLGHLVAERRGRHYHIARASVERYRVELLARQRGESS